MSACTYCGGPGEINDPVDGPVPCPTCQPPAGHEDPAEAAERHANGAGRNGHSSRKPAPRRVRLTSLADIAPRPVRWTWKDRIPTGEVTLTPGRGGIGKSTFHAWLIAKITNGTLPGVHHGTPKPCIIVAAEDSFARTVVPRLIAARADLTKVYRADVVTDDSDAEMSLSLPADCEALEAGITDTDVALVSLDPLMSVIHGSIDTYKDREVRSALEPLVQMADRTGTSILANAHFNKGTGNDPMSLVMGSAAFGNVVRAALGFARDTDDSQDGGGGSCVISQVKNNLGRTDLPSLQYAIEAATVETQEGDAEVGRLIMQGETDRSVADILAASGGASDDASDAEKSLKVILKDGPVWVKQAMDGMAEAGFSKHQANRAKSKLKVRSERLGKPGDPEAGWKWVLPPEGSEDRKDRGGGPPSQPSRSSQPSPSSGGPAHPSPALRLIDGDDQ